MRTGVYFALESSGRYLKIGYSHWPGRRLGALRHYAEQRFGSAGVQYIGIIRGGENTEKRLQRRFRQFSIGGEWFEAAPSILEYLESKRSAFLPIEHFYCQKLPH